MKIKEFVFLISLIGLILGVFMPKAKTNAHNEERINKIKTATLVRVFANESGPRIGELSTNGKAALVMDEAREGDNVEVVSFEIQSHNTPVNHGVVCRKVKP